MFRFDAKEGYYLYPETDSKEDKILQLNSGSTYEGNVAPRDNIHLTKHGLKIPVEADSYYVFVSQMQENEMKFRKVLIGSSIKERNS